MTKMECSIEEDPAERLRVSYRVPRNVVVLSGCLYGSMAITFFIVGLFTTLVLTIIGLVLAVVSTCVLISSGRVFLTPLTIDSASKSMMIGNRKITKTFDAIERIELSDIGGGLSLLVFPREGPSITAVFALSTDQAAFLKEQIERRVGVQVIVVKVEKPRDSSTSGEVPFVPPPKD
jgi:hypothetical protein